MLTHVIILAQGTQQRLIGCSTPKQLLPLPACGGTPIVARTMGMVGRLLRAWPEQAHLVTMVTWHEVWRDLPHPWTGTGLAIELVSLLDPGNSSLKGIARYLDGPREKLHQDFDRTVVLLGDVVYSWPCLEQLFDVGPEESSDADVFAVSPDLSASAGELWGLAWHRDAEVRMRAALRTALEKHSAHDDIYQPGQLRRWYYARIAQGMCRVAVVGDYTMDVDLPAHIDQLGAASLSAVDDDKAHGLLYGQG